MVILMKIYNEEEKEKTLLRLQITLSQSCKKKSTYLYKKPKIEIVKGRLCFGFQYGLLAHLYSILFGWSVVIDGMGF